MKRTPEPPIATIAAALKRERERAGLSLAELARRAGVAKSTLSQLEAGSGNPSVETLWSLGNALDVPLSRLIEPPAPKVRVIRAGENPRVTSEQAFYTGSLLTAGDGRARRDVYIIESEPGAVRRAEPHLPGTVEHAIVAFGRVRIGPADEPVELNPGDYVSYPGDAPHVYEGLEPGSWAVLIMEHP
ncbi:MULTISPECIES: helix-turn-helix domain-containing protein [Catenuloplanes]|uniref:Transcriptional regulator with XRE-family HTH domain n=1 Tax=Catenuloplanes niger TaxID=587534 RepID=A0AAE4CSW1_9ACTN|nr:XRE family transcriptional regulator [Catenuloplanes niger]MDR7321703.1 transcriptional regulator with XRE-family HTH domain [Catenuloplanes niger]